MTETRKIKLSQIASEARDYIDQVPALDPSNSEQPVIVEQSPSGRYGIVDGFHRTAGYLRWCEAQEIDAAACDVTVVVTDDADLIADAAEPSDRQRAAIDAIYAAAGL